MLVRQVLRKPKALKTKKVINLEGKEERDEHMQ
jgi:hypothetical protein